MFETMADLWQALPPAFQDTLWLLALLAPTLIVGGMVCKGYRPFGLIGALLWRYRWTNLVFILLIAVSVGIGVGLIAQERGLRKGSARAAEKFDLIVAAPGSEITMLFASVYLRPSDVPLLDAARFQDVASNPRVDMAAPIAFGDSYAGAPVVGTTAEFISHLAGNPVEGRMFQTSTEAVAGAAVSLPLGSKFSPDHGVGDGAEHGAHDGHVNTIVGRMSPTGSPWDKAILVPVEGAWEVHGLPNGHPPHASDRLGPPFDPEFFPGTPAVLVRAHELWANYALRSEFTRDDMMAFLPGAVLAQLHSVMGDIRQVMSVMAVLTQVLVTAGVLTGLIVLTRLFSRRLALLRALGAPRRFVFSVVWGHAATLIATGSLAGLMVGWIAVGQISRIVSQRTDILVHAQLGWAELHLVAGFVSLTVVLALLPAFLAMSRNVLADLRA